MLALVAAAAASQPPPGHEGVQRPRSAAAARLVAEERGDTPEVAALLAGRDPDARDAPRQRTALMWAILRQDAAAFERFIAATPNLGAVDDRGSNVLAIAVETAMSYDTGPIVASLVAKGARPGPSVGAGGMSLLMMAANAGSAAIVGALLPLLEPGEIDAAGPDGATALGIAASAGARDIAYLLLQHGARIDRPDFDGKTPLIRAAGRRVPGTLETVKLLLEMGANPSAEDKKGNTAVSEAERRGSSDVVELLKRAGAAR